MCTHAPLKSLLLITQAACSLGLSVGEICLVGWGWGVLFGGNCFVDDGALLTDPSWFFFFFIFQKKFIYFWLCWVFIAVRGLSLVAVSGGYSLAVARGL